MSKNTTSLIPEKERQWSENIVGSYDEDDFFNTPNGSKCSIT